MHAILVIALVGCAAAGVFCGLRVRRGSFLAGLALPRTEADRQAGGWLAFLVIRNPGLCRAVEKLSSVLPGHRADVESAVKSTTTFTHLQSRTILHRYFRWQVHNIVRVLCALLFCGVVSVCMTGTTTLTGHHLIGLGSALLCTYSLANWWRIRFDCVGARKFCSSARAQSDEVVNAFTELSRGALRQAVAFALVFVCNLSFQVLVLVDANRGGPSSEASLEHAQRVQANPREAPKTFAG